MKKISLIFSLLLLISIGVFSQDFVKIVLLDSALQTPISNVKITNKTLNSISYSGFNGSQAVEIIGSTAVLVLEHLSYNKKTIRITANDPSPKYIYLSQNNVEINEIVVSASKNDEVKKSTPYLIKTISNDENEKSLLFSVDDYLQNQSNFSVSRPQGIYTNSPIITTSGMGGIPGRTLVMFNGISLNKTDDGNVNWNMLSASNIEKTEIIANSASTIYGNNAMGGAINFISKKPVKKGFEGFASAFYGSFNTIGAEFNVSYQKKKAKGFYFNANVFSQMSDGYISTPDSLQFSGTEYIPTYLKEIKANLLIGYNLNNYKNVEIIYNFYDDERGLGEKIQEEKGSYTEHDSQLIIAKFDSKKHKTNWGLNIYAQNESYFKNIEKLKNNDYSLIYVDSKRQDVGSNIFLNYKPVNKIGLTSGINLKYGNVDGRDNYQTSSDIVINKGEIVSAEGFIQTKISPLNNNNLNLILGANYNNSYLQNAEFSIENPTSATDFMTDFTGKLENNVFENISFNSGIRYNFAKKFSIWSSFNRGYNAPSLDDMTRSGLIRYGFKLANPNLHSENLYNTNYGLGFYSKNISISLDGNYNIGNDFIYYVETGDAIFGGNKKIIQKQNITQVKMYNFNADLSYKLKKFEIFGNYTYNISEISAFESQPELEGKYLMYSPVHKANAGVLLKLSIYTISLTSHYTSEQFTDNENISTISPYYTFDFKISSMFFNKLEVSYGIQNLFDYKYVLYDNQLSIGKFYNISMKYHF
ncbi:MAG: TonB-dependent receptor [Bacteroidales bacterium]|nr:TonB-dependent receptor [Bacteroidales bacterium]